MATRIPVDTVTASTWTRCKHQTGWYMTAKIWLFKKRYFVCSDCGEAIEAKLFDLMYKPSKPSKAKK